MYFSKHSSRLFNSKLSDILRAQLSDFFNGSKTTNFTLEFRSKNTFYIAVKTIISEIMKAGEQGSLVVFKDVEAMHRLKSGIESTKVLVAYAHIVSKFIMT